MVRPSVRGLSDLGLGLTLLEKDDDARLPPYATVLQCVVDVVHVKLYCSNRSRL